ncbi:MAG: DUF4214 domain-containing protein, partial [Lachnospiraceae bacterium]|nr:DUF4214 domain-containing protein [Lachnospiraceae bacterium]
MNNKIYNNLKITYLVITIFMLFGAILFVPIKVYASEDVNGFINRCYLVTVGREADEEGFEYWNNKITNSELVGTQVAYGFVFSDEYQGQEKSNEEYVNDLYMLFLGREPDEEGFDNWVNALEGGANRLSVFAGFANSDEFYNLCSNYGITAGYFTDECENERLNGVNLFVDRLYRICLGRQGEKDGQEYWVRALLKGELTGTDCAAGFANSPEYRNNGLTDIEYVENMYKACLGRNSESNGLKYWVTALVNGLTRDELFEGFANSDEFEGICANYGIIRGTYIAKEKGTYNPDNPDLIPVDIPDNPVDPADPIDNPENPIEEPEDPEELFPLEKYEFDISEESFFEGDYSDEEMGDYMLSFHGTIKEFSGIYAGKDYDGSNYVKVDCENIYVYSYGAKRGQYELIVPIEDYIEIIIDADLRNHAKITVSNGTDSQIIESI